MKTHLTATLLVSTIFSIGAPVFAQQYEALYPNGLTAIAREPLPPKVYLAQQNVVEIRGKFFRKGQPDQLLADIQGSGFVETSSGYVVSARHNLVESAIDIWSRYGFSSHLNQKGIPVSQNYEYQFYAIVHTATTALEYPLEKVCACFIAPRLETKYTQAGLLVIRPIIPMQADKEYG